MCTLVLAAFSMRMVAFHAVAAAMLGAIGLSETGATHTRHLLNPPAGTLTATGSDDR
jgi:hypothetical protein